MPLKIAVIARAFRPVAIFNFIKLKIAEFILSLSEGPLAMTTLKYYPVKKVYA